MPHPYLASGSVPALSRAPRGGALLYVIAAIALLGALGGGVAYFSSSSSTSQLVNTRAEQAYYAALAGQDYLAQQQAYYETDPNGRGYGHEDAIFTDFQAAMATNGGLRSLDGSRRFTITITNASATSPFLYTGTVVGSYVDASGNVTENFRIDTTKSGSADDPFIPIVTPPTEPDTPEPDEMGRMTPVVVNRARLDTGVYGTSVTLGNQSYVKGDVISQTTVTVGNLASVGGDVCAGGNVTLNNQASVNGDVNTPGNVTIGSNAAVIKGSVFAGGTVTLQNTAQVLGEIHAGGAVTLGSNAATVGGTLRTTGDVSLGQQCLVSGDVHSGGNIANNGGTIAGSAWAQGTISVNVWNNAKILGSSYQNAPVPPRQLPTAPTACAEVKKPPLQSYAAGSTNITVSWGAAKNITPGSYGNLTTGGSNDVTLHSGTYYFNSITTGYNTRLKLDVSGGDILIFVVNGVSLSSCDIVPVQVSTDGNSYGNMDSVDKALAAKVYMETHANFTAGNYARWFGTILAKSGIAFSGGALATGTYNIVGALSTVDDNAYITLSDAFQSSYVKSNFAKDHW